LSDLGPVTLVAGSNGETPPSPVEWCFSGCVGEAARAKIPSDSSQLDDLVTAYDGYAGLRDRLRLGGEMRGEVLVPATGAGS